ncbi:MAG: 2-oxo-4-hydroxy-4-carboxy-5-ureidoimidazoline decarboxylase [Pirellulales bacterium]
MNDATVNWLNELDAAAAAEQFRKCCGADAWVTQMVASRPFDDGAALRAAAERCFDELQRDDWLAAFNSHPRIGDLNSLRMRLAGNKQWSAAEQSGISAADEATIQRLADGNKLYDERFGYPFIICATGKMAAEMCAMLYERLNSDSSAELPIAAAEQRKITHLRLEKLAPPDVA